MNSYYSDEPLPKFDEKIANTLINENFLNSLTLANILQEIDVKISGIGKKKAANILEKFKIVSMTDNMRFSEKPNFVIEAYRYATRIGGFNLTFIELMQILWDVEFRDIVLKVLNKQADIFEQYNRNQFQYRKAFVLLNGNQNQAFVQKFFHLLRNNHFDYHTFGDDNNVNIQNLTNADFIFILFDNYLSEAFDENIEAEGTLRYKEFGRLLYREYLLKLIHKDQNRIHVFQMPDIAHIEYHWLNEHRINAQIQDENQLNEVLGKLNPQNTT